MDEKQPVGAFIEGEAERNREDQKGSDRTGVLVGAGEGRAQPRTEGFGQGRGACWNGGGTVLILVGEAFGQGRGGMIGMDGGGRAYPSTDAFAQGRGACRSGEGRAQASAEAFGAGQGGCRSGDDASLNAAL